MADFINTGDLIGEEALMNSLIDRSITEFNSNAIKTLADYAFAGCAALTSVKLPALTSTSGLTFSECTALEKADFSSITSFKGNDFMGCSCLTAVIMRSSSTASLGFKNMFHNTPIASGTGYIYVPRALVDRYKSATNWSNFAAQFRALEDYTVDGTVTGELDPNKI